MPRDYHLLAPKVGRLERHFPVGARTDFRLFVQPCEWRDGKRRMLADAGAQRAWLDGRAAAAGFALVRAELEQRPWRSSKKQLHGVFPGALFEGALEVTEPALFAQILGTGIGPGKAFGFGLLSLFHPSDLGHSAFGAWEPILRAARFE